MIPSGTDGNRDNKIFVQTKLGQVIEQKEHKDQHKNFDFFLEQYYRFLRQNNYSNNSIKSYCNTVRHVFQDKKLNTLSQQELDDIRFDLVEHYQHNGNRMRFAAINLFCKEILKKEIIEFINNYAFFMCSRRSNYACKGNEESENPYSKEISSKRFFYRT